MKRLLALMLCFALSLCGCAEDPGPYVPTGDGLSYDDEYTGPQNTTAPEETAQTLSLAYYPQFGFNPYLCTDYTNRALFSLLYQSLFTINREYVAEPQLCKRFTMTEDMKHYTFYLEEAAFSNGEVLTVEDAVASLHAAWKSNYYKGRFLHVVSIAASADGGVEIVTDTPYENLPLLLDVPIIRASQVAADRPDGTGPYTINPTADGDSLRRKTNWWCKAKVPVTAELITLFRAESTTHIRDQFEFADLSIVCADPGSDRYVDYRCDYELWDCENGIFLYLGICENSKVFAGSSDCADLCH